MSETDSAAAPFDIKRVMAALPHRYPMLLVDRVEELVLDQTHLRHQGVTSTNLSSSISRPSIMPGVLIVEALARLRAFSRSNRSPRRLGKLVSFMAIDGAKFRTPVEPGVLLRLDVEFVQKRWSVCKSRAGPMSATARGAGRFHSDDRGSADGLAGASAVDFSMPNTAPIAGPAITASGLPSTATRPRSITISRSAPSAAARDRALRRSRFCRGASPQPDLQSGSRFALGSSRAEPAVAARGRGRQHAAALAC